MIFLTARREKDDLVKGFEAGAVDYLTKPFYPLELRGTKNSIQGYALTLD